MKPNKMYNCAVCKTKTDVVNGGIALMVAMCIESTTNFCNMALCEKCYKKYAEKPLRELSEKAKLSLYFGDDEEENQNELDIN